MDIIAYSKGAAAQKVAESKVRYYSQEAEPTNVQVGDQWNVPSTGKTYERQSDGTTEVWFDVSPSATVQSLDSSGTAYDNVVSGLTATNVKDAIDEVASETNLNTTAMDNSAVSTYASQLIQGDLVLTNTEEVPTQVAVTYTGNGTSQSIVTNMSTIDFTQASNGTGYYLDRTIHNKVVPDSSSQLLGNYNFSDTSSWTIDTGWEISGGLLKEISGANASNAYQTISTAIGKEYDVVVQTNTVSGSFSFIIKEDSIGGTLVKGTTIDSTGKSNITFVATSTTTCIQLSSYGSGEFDYISAREVSTSGHIDFASISGIDGVSKVHIKGRDTAYNNLVYDGLRGTGGIETNTADVEDPPTNQLTDYTTTGFSVGASGYVNANTHNYIAYQTLYTNIKWSYSNHGKLIVEAYNPQSLDVMIYYEGSGIAGHEISHSLGREIGFTNIKRLEVATEWFATNESGYYLYLNTTDKRRETTSHVTALKKDYVELSTANRINAVNEAFILYSFANAYHNEDGKLIGNKECGTYIGTGAAHVVETLGKPAEFIWKPISTTGDWVKLDNQREPDGTNEREIFLNLSSAESSAYGYGSIVNNGYRLISLRANTLSEQYLYIVSYDTKLNGGGAIQSIPTTTTNIQVDATVNVRDGEVSKNIDISGTVDTSGVTESGEYYILEVN
jgi:hypothetical protein